MPTRLAYPPDLVAPTGAWEQAAVFGARYLAERIVARGADAVLAGAGVANLASWLAVQLARAQGAEVELTAELGLWGYEPTPADPFVFNHRSFPTATMLSDSEQILGLMAGSPGHDTARLPRGRPDRPVRQHQLHGHPRPVLPGRVRRRQ